MGQLRIESKNKLMMRQEKYDLLRTILNQARRSAQDNVVFWDLEDNEDSVKVRKEFLYVAENEDISVKIRRLRRTKCLQFEFEGEMAPSPKRMSGDEAAKRILGALETADGPLNKMQVIEASGVKSTTWNSHVKKLIAGGKVRRIEEPGEDGKTVLYALK